MIEVSKGIFQNNDKYLLVKRSNKSKSFPGLWDFPGGKMDPGENPSESLVREIKEETSFSVSAGPEIKNAKYKTDEWDILIHYFQPKILNGKLKLSNEHSEFKWIEEKDILNLESHPAVPAFFE